MAQARPIGRGARFHPPATGPVIGRCRRRLGPRIGVHVELFAANRVVLVPAGIGTRPPRGFSAGRISGAGCYGDLVTLEPTGVVLVRPGARLLCQTCSAPGASRCPRRGWRPSRHRRDASGGVRRRAALARLARRRAADGARRDRARGRPARPAARVLHVPARRVS